MSRVAHLLAALVLVTTVSPPQVCTRDGEPAPAGDCERPAAFAHEHACCDHDHGHAHEAEATAETTPSSHPCCRDGRTPHAHLALTPVMRTTDDAPSLPLPVLALAPVAAADAAAPAVRSPAAGPPLNRAVGPPLLAAVRLLL